MVHTPKSCWASVPQKTMTIASANRPTVMWQVREICEAAAGRCDVPSAASRSAGAPLTEPLLAVIVRFAVMPVGRWRFGGGLIHGNVPSVRA